LSISSFGTKLSMSMVWLLSIWTAQLFLFDLDVLALFQFVTAPLLIAFDQSPVSESTICCFKPIAGFPVDHVEVGFVCPMSRPDKAAPGTRRGKVFKEPFQ